MTTLNTIIEEEKKAFDALVTKKVALPVQYGGKSTTMTSESVNLDEIKDHLTTAIQRAVEYERARIRESFDDWFKNGTEDVEEWAGRVIK